MTRLWLGRRAKLVCAGLWGVGWLAVAALLLLPLGGVQAPGRSDLVGHFLLFAAMAFAAVGISRRPGQLAGLACVTIALSATLEYAQRFAPYRSCEFADGVANSLGACAGYAGALLLLHLISALTRREQV